MSWGKEAIASARRTRLGQLGPRRHQAVGQADAEGLLGGHRPPGEDHVEGPAQAHDAGQALRPPVGQGHPEAALEAAEHGVGAGDAQVAPQRQFQPSGHAGPGDGGNGGFGDAVRRSPASPRAPRPGRRRTRSAPAQKHPAGPGEDADPALRVGIEIPPGALQGLSRGPVDGIAPLRAGRW